MAGFYTNFTSKSFTADGDTDGIGFITVDDVTEFVIGATVSVASNSVESAQYQVAAVDISTNRIGVRLLFGGTPRLNGQTYGLTSVAQYKVADGALVVQDAQFIYSDDDTVAPTTDIVTLGFTVGSFGQLNPNGLVLGGGELALGAADLTHPGGVSTGTQSFAGQKTFATGLLYSGIPANSNLLGVTTGALTLYVSNSGNDNNDGLTAPTALATIQAAYNRIPKVVRHKVIVNLATGTYVGALLSGFHLDPADSTGASISTIGTLVTSSVATGTTSGTATAGSAGSGTTPAFGTLTDSGQTWTIDNLRGKFISITGGTGAGQVYPIASNTATVITISGTWTAPNATSTYVIQDAGAVVNTPITWPGSAVTASFASSACFIVMNGSGANNVDDIYFANLRFTQSVGRSFQFFSYRNQLTNCQFAPTSTSGTIFGAPFVCSLAMNKCAIMLPSNGTGFSLNASILCNITDSLVNGGASGYLASTEVARGLFFTRVYFRGQTTAAINLTATELILSCQVNSCIIDCVTPGSTVGLTTGATIAVGGIIGLTNTSINNCGTAILTVGNIQINLSNVSGSGSTLAASIAKGSRLRISSNTTLTGGTELSIDGATSTIAAMRAASPKVTNNASYFTLAYE